MAIWQYPNLRTISATMATPSYVLPRWICVLLDMQTMPSRPKWSEFVFFSAIPQSSTTGQVMRAPITCCQVSLPLSFFFSLSFLRQQWIRELDWNLPVASSTNRDIRRGKSILYWIHHFWTSVPPSPRYKPSITQAKGLFAHTEGWTDSWEPSNHKRLRSTPNLTEFLHLSTKVTCKYLYSLGDWE